MNQLGKITKADLLEIKSRGVDPRSAVQAIMAEAKRRNPSADSVVLHKDANGGFDIVGL